MFGFKLRLNLGKLNVAQLLSFWKNETEEAWVDENNNNWEPQ